jgi:peptide/nickel transport system permease protein
MSTEAQPIPTNAVSTPKKNAGSSTTVRVVKYTLVRLVMLFITVAVAVYLTILIANMGGFVDQIREGEIRESIQMRVLTDPAMKAMSAEQRTKQMEEMIILEEKRQGLDQPFLIRSTRFLVNALTLNLGRSANMSSDSGSRMVKNIILERLPTTLLLFGVADLILFFLALTIALALSRKYGSFFDKMLIGLAPTSAAPGWFYGIFLILIFAALFRVLPFGGMVDAPPPESKLLYALSVGKHMILPVIAITLSVIFVQSYSWRTFFLIFSSEDYVEMAKAKGLSPRELERRYILRPTLPVIITSFAFLLIGLWSGAPIFETVFQWPGLGRATFQAVGLYDTPMIVGTTVIFAYLLALTVFLLDFVYAIVDPRVKVGGSGGERRN